MQKQLNNLIKLTILVMLVSCGAKTSDSTTKVTEKKKELESLKKQQQQLTDQIAALEKEIYTLDHSSKPEKAKLFAVTTLATQNFNHYIDLQAKVDADNVSLVTTRGGVT